MEHSPSRLETTEAEANKTTSGKEKDLQDVNAQIQKREGKIEEVQAEIKQLQGEIKQLQGEIKQLQAEIKQLQAKIDAEREKHSPNDETIQELKEREKGLVELRSSYLKQQSTYLTYLNRLLDLFKHVSGKASCKGSPSRFFIGIAIYFVTLALCSLPDRMQKEREQGTMTRRNPLISVVGKNKCMFYQVSKSGKWLKVLTTDVVFFWDFRTRTD